MDLDGFDSMHGSLALAEVKRQHDEWWQRQQQRQLLRKVGTDPKHVLDGPASADADEARREESAR